MTVWIDTPTSFPGPSNARAAAGIAAGRQMHAIGAGELGQRRFAVQHEPRAVSARERQQQPRNSGTCSSSGKSFSRKLTQRQPAAKRRGNDLGERPPRLPAVGHQQQWRIGKRIVAPFIPVVRHARLWEICSHPRNGR